MFSLLTTETRIRLCNRSEARIILEEIQSLLTSVVESPTHTIPPEDEVYLIRDFIEDLIIQAQDAPQRREEFEHEYVFLNYLQKAVVWLVQYVPDLNNNCFFLDFLQKQNFRLSSTRNLRDSTAIHRQNFEAEEETTKKTRPIIFQCRVFNDVKSLFRDSSVPKAIDCLRVCREFLESSKVKLEFSDIDKFRFWRIQNAMTLFLDLLSVLFNEDEKLFNSFLPPEQGQILFTIKDAFESVLLMEKIMCLFFSSEKGLPWIPEDGLFNVNLNTLRWGPMNEHPLKTTIDSRYIYLVKKYYRQQYLLHLAPCRPLHWGGDYSDISDTSKWCKKYVRLPGGSVGSFWELEIVDQDITMTQADTSTT
jgi:hypothetical protein